LDLGKLVLQVLQERIVESKLALQGAIRDTAQALQHGDGLRQDLLECHNRPSACPGALGVSLPVAHLTRRPANTQYVTEKAEFVRRLAQSEAVRLLCAR